MKKTIRLCLLFLVVFASCKKETLNSNEQAGEKVTAAGFGASTAAFTGTTWQLPQGIVLKDSIREASWWTDVHMGQPIAPNFYCGVPGGIFTVCFCLQNTTGQTITIQFPQEILIYSHDIKTQNGLIILMGTITIPAHSEQVVMAGAFCINANRSAPDLYNHDGQLQAFSFGPAAVPAPLKEITDILKAKNLTYKDLVLPNGLFDVEKMSRLFVVQTAIWEVTDGDGLTAETKAALLAL